MSTCRPWDWRQGPREQSKREAPPLGACAPRILSAAQAHGARPHLWLGKHRWPPRSLETIVPERPVLRHSPRARAPFWKKSGSHPSPVSITKARAGRPGCPPQGKEQKKGSPTAPHTCSQRPLQAQQKAEEGRPAGLESHAESLGHCLCEDVPCGAGGKVLGLGALRGAGGGGQAWLRYRWTGCRRVPAR